MKQILIDIVLIFATAAAITACSGKRLVKNCEHKGSQIFECEDL